MSRLLYTQDCRWLEKILSHYIDTINSASFDSDTKLADIFTQMAFVPLRYLFERILDVPASSPPVERAFSNSGLRPKSLLTSLLRGSYLNIIAGVKDFPNCAVVFSWRRV